MRKNRFLEYDLIGKRVRILTHSDPSLVGREGIIILETEKTFLVKAGDNAFSVYKPNGIYEIDFKRRRLTICGDALIGKPIKRLR
ncbi:MULTISPECIES: ribonuclease P protein component 1 [Metallosphaera]|uniref:Ribonuclease P protein component 1 n=3 Tax=Metallosphaera TaxID=41980 RepID=A4YCX4_METS5|nr:MULTISPECIES: ribonuclease P protein subunit [Metallosphaera]ABP94276.1 Ribonuclease P, Rpp29 [Metallosphaera sedula DSM 5348]AIM26263.1 Ribonuclease P, Rpp29 [Metallosphaera sedula]AKV73278.1 ribonuclease P [Metallosphaera sedula]AKV75522.1 ribonuclease P [Metallosphaera sedula]AKV77768.1 ribonuclease P [Metallosphaera sedula]